MDQATAKHSKNEGHLSMSHARCSCISVVMPVRNEERHIEDALRSLQKQALGAFQLEILAIDGMSDDGTCQKIEALAASDARIKLLHNPSRHTPAALNIGLRAAKGEYVCIMGAHAHYEPDYIAVCLRELLAHNAIGCSGKVITTAANDSLQARLVAWAAASPFASSSRSVRTQQEGYVDTVPFPVMRKQALLELGGYNEHLVRNQDNDMNQRLRAVGLRLYATAKTSCRYYARPDIRSFLKYAFSSGLWNAFTLKQHSNSLALRHFVPPVFVACLFVLIAGSFTDLIAHSSTGGLAALLLSAVVALHLGLGSLAGLQTAMRQKTAAALWLAPVILSFHCAYGLGTLWGFLRPHELPPEKATILPASPTRRLPESSKDAA